MKGAFRILLAIVGVLALALAGMYFTMPAARLPLPDALGHQAGSQIVHVKHGIAAVVVGLASLVLCWDMGPPLK